jgi:hypothetical protein
VVSFHELIIPRGRSQYGSPWRVQPLLPRELGRLGRATVAMQRAAAESETSLLEYLGQVALHS